MAQFSPIYGTIVSLEPFDTTSGGDGCVLSFTMMTQDMGPVQLLINASTYVEDQETFEPGDTIVAFYDTTLPMPLIYPPRYTAVVAAKVDDRTQAAFDYFNENLTNTDNTLKLNIDRQGKNELLLANGQVFPGNPANHYLLVLYSFTTRSIPAMTTPEKVIVFCGP